MKPNTRPLTAEELNMREALSGRAEPTQSEYTKETLTLRADVIADLTELEKLGTNIPDKAYALANTLEADDWHGSKTTEITDFVINQSL